jgi:hypothetical protein
VRRKSWQSRPKALCLHGEIFVQAVLAVKFMAWALGPVPLRGDAHLCKAFILFVKKY